MISQSHKSESGLINAKTESFWGTVRKDRLNKVHVLCFHCNAIKNKNANHSIQKVQNLGNERRDNIPRPKFECQMISQSHIKSESGLINAKTESFWGTVRKDRLNKVHVLCFHCNAIKNKNANHSIQKVQNLGNERREIYKKNSKNEL